MPSARSARTPPTPSTAYCASRIARLLSYRREVIQRPTWLFSGRSVSSRYSGTRPTSTRQTCAVTSSSSIGTVTVSGWPSAPVTFTQGSRSGSASSQYSCWQAGDVDALVEVAGAVHQADADHRQGEVGGLLQDVAGQHAEAAGVDRQRAMHAELGAAERDRVLGLSRARRSTAGRVGAQLLRQASTAATNAASAAARAQWTAASRSAGAAGCAAAHPALGVNRLKGAAPSADQDHR